MPEDLPAGACSVLGASSGEAAVAAAAVAAVAAVAAGAAAAAVEVSAGLSAGLVAVASESVLPDFLDFFLKAALSLALRLSRAPRAIAWRNVC